jgi:hypothetical protein
MDAKGAAQPETTAYYRDLCEQQARTIEAHETHIAELEKRIAILECWIELAKRPDPA